MAWVVHSKWLERHFDGTAALDLESAGAHASLKLGIVTNSAIDADTDNLYSGLTAVGTGTAWTGPVALNNCSITLNGSNNLVFNCDDPAQIAADAGGGFNNARSLVIYESTNSYILAHHIEGATFGNVSATIDIDINATSGIWILTI